MQFELIGILFAGSTRRGGSGRASSCVPSRSTARTYRQDGANSVGIDHLAPLILGRFAGQALRDRHYEGNDSDPGRRPHLVDSRARNKWKFRL